jgi:NADPH-dependent curcumin reductase CurA
LKPGDFVLVTAAAGGVGIAAVQLAKGKKLKVLAPAFALILIYAYDQHSEQK